MDNAAIEALPPLREVIAQQGLSAKKSLGQNFLLDLNLTRRIARSAGDLSKGVTVEVGPGPGGLTRALLLEGADKVIAIEKDQRAIGALAPLIHAAEGRLEVIEADALKFDFSSLGSGPIRIVANLPYNISTRLVLGWLKMGTRFEALTLMFQKEVANRLTAPPGDGDYGRLSVVVQWLAETEQLFDVPARAFKPEPKITSTIVQLRPRETPLAPADQDQLEKVTATAFGQRRKMLRASLKSMGGEKLLTSVGIDPTSRPEQLSIEQFCALANATSDR